MPIYERSKVRGGDVRSVKPILGLFLISGFDTTKFDMTLFAIVN